MNWVVLFCSLKPELFLETWMDVGNLGQKVSSPDWNLSQNVSNSHQSLTWNVWNSPWDLSWNIPNSRWNSNWNVWKPSKLPVLLAMTQYPLIFFLPNSAFLRHFFVCLFVFQGHRNFVSWQTKFPPLEVDVCGVGEVLGALAGGQHGVVGSAEVVDPRNAGIRALWDPLCTKSVGFGNL